MIRKSYYLPDENKLLNKSPDAVDVALRHTKNAGKASSEGLSSGASFLGLTECRLVI